MADCVKCGKILESAVDRYDRIIFLCLRCRAESGQPPHETPRPPGWKYPADGTVTLLDESPLPKRSVCLLIGFAVGLLLSFALAWAFGG